MLLPCELGGVVLVRRGGEGGSGERRGGMVRKDGIEDFGN